MSPRPVSVPDTNRLVIGEGVTIKGEIGVPDTLIVYGVLEGDASVGTLVVGETGVVRGRIVVAQNADVSGKVFERLDVKCLLTFHASGRVNGNVSYGMLQIEQGACIAGGITSTDYRPEPKSAAAADYRADQRDYRAEQRTAATADYRPEQRSAAGDGVRRSKQSVLSDLSVFEPVLPPAAPF